MENYPQYANWVSLAFSHLVEHKNSESKNPENLGRPIGYRVLRNDWRTYSSDSCQEMPELTLSDYELFWPFRTHLLYRVLIYPKPQGTYKTLHTLL